MTRTTLHPRVAALFSLLAVMLLMAVGPSARPALAHGEELSDQASELVRQSIALIVADPEGRGEIVERVEAALVAPDVSGVDLALVDQANTMLAAGDDVAEVRPVLEASLASAPSAPPPDEAATGGAPATTGSDTGSMTTMPTGSDPGSTVIADPLETRPVLAATDWVVLFGALAVGLAGVWLALRFRPETARSEVTR